MKLFPRTEIKEFGSCDQGEFIEFISNGKTVAGLCVQDEEESSRLLILASADSSMTYRVVPLQDSTPVISYGHDWTLSPYGPLQKRDDAFKEGGRLLLTPEGVFMVATERRAQGFDDQVVCRVDAASILDIHAAPRSGFSRQYWRIHYYDAEMDARQKLAGKDEPEQD